MAPLYIVASLVCPEKKERRFVSTLYGVPIMSQIFSILLSHNQGKSGASFCLYVAAWVSDPFCNFCENHKIDDNSITTKAREKISTDLELLEFFMYV
jgi:hypothetical protein